MAQLTATEIDGAGSSFFRQLNRACHTATGLNSGAAKVI
jgi:hypothetical protein